jgi:thiosulfate sulfurtransferase
VTTFKHLQVNDLPALIESGNAVIADIRDANAFNAGHIKGAQHLTNETISEFIRNSDMDAPVVVCCYHGHSSQQAAQYLISQDFTDVYSLDGGFTAWQLQYPELVEH